MDMLVRGKKTGLCYRWEEAACLPTPEQADVLKQHMPLGAEFDAALQDATRTKSGQYSPPGPKRGKRQRGRPTF